MAREAELDDVKKQIDEAGRELRRPQLTKRLERELDPKGELGAAFDAEGERREGERRSAKGRDAGADDGATPRAGDGRPPEAPPQTDDERPPTPASSGAGER
jgi:hypothetical protein